MSIAGLTFLFSALFLHEQEIEGLSIEVPNVLSGEVQGNFRSADMNHDGQPDLLLPDRVMLQRGGEFPPNLSIVLPRIDGLCVYDIFDSVLYVRTPGALETYRIDGTNWKNVATQRLFWPDMTGLESSDDDTAQDTGTAQWGRFLHDVNGDGVPEILLLGHAGLLVYASNDERYGFVRTLDVYPERMAIVSPGMQVWPPSHRRYVFPASRLAFRMFVDKTMLTFVSGQIGEDDLVQHTVTRHRLDPESEYAVQADTIEPHKSSLLPAFLQPCRLNGDDTVDYAGMRSFETNTGLLPERIYEIYASTDGGNSIQVYRTKAFPPLCAFTDMDGDGDLDIVLESTGFFEGGIRDFLTRLTSHRSLVHSLDVHFQHDDGSFSLSPDMHHEVTIKLERPPIQNGRMFATYKEGRSYNLTGDLDGDGRRDLVVQTHPNRLSVFLNQGTRFTRSPQRTFEIPKMEGFAVADIDADGRSDIVLTTPDATGPGGTTARVFFIRGDGS